jgi:hypothetical protein
MILTKEEMAQLNFENMLLDAEMLCDFEERPVTWLDEQQEFDIYNEYCDRMMGYYDAHVYEYHENLWTHVLTDEDGNIISYCRNSIGE